MIKDLWRDPASISPVGFIVNKTSHRPHVWNTKRSAAFTACRWSSVKVCINELCVGVSLGALDAKTDNKQTIFMNSI